MEIISAILLGIIQGATEFLPVSSSGHLLLAEHFFQVEGASLTFDVMLHLATLGAILVYFRRDFTSLTLAFFGRPTPGDNGRQRQLAIYICAATVPAVVAGLLLGKYAETIFRSPALVAVSLSVAGLLLLWAEKAGRHARHMEKLRFRDAMLIGCAQALALIPGVSRSGATITAGLFLGLTRDTAARFSFLLSAPVVAGAGGYKAMKLFSGPGLSNDQLLFYGAGFIAAALSGYAIIAFLMRFVQTKSLAVFAYYRFAITAIVFIALALGY
ncbi:MAG: undecaprenyl-diphosphatase UppP [Thermodesulfobacteriota bacterium]